MADIFISYSKKDWDRIQPILRGLDEAGIGYWIDDQIYVGDSWTEVIKQEILNAKLVLVIWTRNSITSNFVQDECRFADRIGKPILQVCLDDVSVPFGFGAYQYADFSRWKGRTGDRVWQRLIVAIRRKAGLEPDDPVDPDNEGGGIGGAGPQPPETPDRRSGMWVPLIIVAVIGVGVASQLERIQGWLTPPPTEQGAQTPPPSRCPDGSREGPNNTSIRTQTVSSRAGEVCFEMVRLPGGRFTMGSQDCQGDKNPGIGYDDECPRRQVSIQPFEIGRHEVTWTEWDACVADGGCDNGPVESAGGDNGWGRGRRPVIEVSWNDAKAYVRWLSDKTGHTYRLLSEAEWEYAARAGTTTRYAWGDEDPECDEASTRGANFSACADDRTRPVGSFRNAANAFGLYDMHGNVWEWVEDCWHKTYEGAPTDGSARLTNCDSSSRVLRGGSWLISPYGLRSASRVNFNPTVRSLISGFRVARTL